MMDIVDTFDVVYTDLESLFCGLTLRLVSPSRNQLRHGTPYPPFFALPNTDLPD